MGLSSAGANGRPLQVVPENQTKSSETKGLPGRLSSGEAYSPANKDRLVLSAVDYHFRQRTAGLFQLTNYPAAPTNDTEVGSFSKHFADGAAREIGARNERGTRDGSYFLAGLQDGVVGGFDDVTSELSYLGLLDMSAQGLLQDLQTTLNDSLDRLQSQAGVVAGSTTRFESAFSQSRDIELELRTREGDSVTLKISRSQSGSFSATEAAISGAGFSREAISTQSTRQQGFSFEFSVEGDLNEEEMEAIVSLMSQVGSISEEFFQGNALKAFENLGSLGFDADQIAGFSLDLSSQTTVALSLQQATVAAGLGDSNHQGRGQHPLQALLSVVQGLHKGLGFLSFTEKPGETLLQLLDRTALEVRPKTAAQEDGYQERFRNLNEQLIEALEKLD